MVDFLILDIDVQNDTRKAFKNQKFTSKCMEN